MDGLTISNSQKLLETGKTTSELRNEQFKPPSLQEGQTSFADTLKQAVGSVNEMQKTSDKMMENLSAGRSQNIHEVMIAAEKADIALKLMVQVRNKIIEAYQEVMKMQV